jgi:hypothetical protein
MVRLLSNLRVVTVGIAEQVSDVPNAGFQEGRAPHVVAHGTPGLGSDIGWIFGGDLEGDGDRNVCLVKVGDIEDERVGVTGVNEPEPGSAAERDDYGVHHAVQAGVGGG